MSCWRGRLIQDKSLLVLTLDRTTWDSGASCVNILLLGVAYKGLAFPLLWVFLDKKGNVLDKAAHHKDAKFQPSGPVHSDPHERLALLDTLLRLVEAERIEAVVADLPVNAGFRGSSSVGLSL